MTSAGGRWRCTGLCDAARDQIQAGTRDVRAITEGMREILDKAEPAKIDYASIVDPGTMQPVEQIERPVLVALAVWIGKTRLIDNVLVDPDDRSA